MARPHIEFIQSQSLPWVPADRFGLSGGVKMKVLSEDGETGRRPSAPMKNSWCWRASLAWATTPTPT
jgi:hypothetical protein